MLYMKFKPGNYYRHRNCIDMDIRILSIHPASRGRTLYKVSYVSQRNHEFMFDWEYIFIKEEQHNNWSIVSP